ncbi:MAG: hypothetical protein A2Z81_10060 [Omnitrophica WOR_2 bacterium GWA2_45_18]|nr:MAG: hypothetical protein A2Z81_10060 [Omnitrophica WOR_2 bacterium GWA2_45_18]
MSQEKILQTIQKHKKFLISTHVNPDPDAICSELAMAIYLRSLHKQVFIVNEERVPSRLAFLSGADKIKGRQDVPALEYDVALVVDCGDIKRIGDVQNLLKADKPLINIDHHITNTDFGSCNLVRTEASSTAEVIYDLLIRAKCRLNKSLAEHLYAGIMTDTGSFRFENTTCRTHQIAGELMKYKFSPTDLYRRFYETIPLNDLKAFTKLISRFEMDFEGRVVCVELRKKDLSKFSEEFDLRDTIFKFLRSCKGVEVYVILTEIKPGLTRVNLRSSRSVNVAQLAHHFNGGGHRKASGCTIEKDMKAARRDFLNELKKVL